jgi:hypothetical protein
LKEKRRERNNYCSNSKMNWMRRGGNRRKAIGRDRKRI